MVIIGAALIKKGKKRGKNKEEEKKKRKKKAQYRMWSRITNIYLGAKRLAQQTNVHRKYLS